MSVLEEIRRRNVLRPVLAYAIAAWVFAQVLELATDAFDAPAWVLKLVITVLVMGGVPVAIFAWVYEMTPEGLRREIDLAADRPPDAADRRLNVAIVTLLVVAIALFAGSRFWPSPQAPVSTTEAIEASAPIDAAALGPKSIAVLPFENFSSSDDDAHFSDGLADTVLHRLAQLDDLTVIARNSSFVYKGSNVDIRRVGEDLGVAHVLEGSVQRQGDRLRVIAQLIETASGSHLWSETFDRSLSDIFSIQDDIALSVAEALQVELLGEEAVRLTATGTDDPVAWGLYLAAQATIDEQSLAGRFDARDLLIQAIERDRGFVEAYLYLARMYDFIGWLADSPSERAAALENGLEAAHRAAALDPSNPNVLRALGQIYRRQGRTLESVALLEAYVKQAPNDSEAHMILGLARHDHGDYEAAYPSFVEGYRLDPNQWVFLRQLGFTSMDLGEIDRGVEWYRKGIQRTEDRDGESAWSIHHSDLARMLSVRLGRLDLGLAELEGHVNAERGLRNIIEALLPLDLFEEAGRVNDLLRRQGDPMAVLYDVVRADADPAFSGPVDIEASRRAAANLFNRGGEYEAWLCLHARDYACALEALRPIGRILVSDFDARPFVADADDTRMAIYLGLAELMAGDPDTGRRFLSTLLESIESRPPEQTAPCGRSCFRPYVIAEIRSALGHVDGAIDALAQAFPDDTAFYRNGLLTLRPIEQSPFLDPVRDRPEFASFVEELNRRKSAMREAVRPTVDRILQDVFP